MSSNVSKQNACNVTSLSKLVKPLTVSKSVSSTILSKSNICKHKYCTSTRQSIKGTSTDI